MLGLLLIFFVGQSYYKLAEEFGKKKWLFVILGIVIFYGASLVFVFSIVIMYMLADPDGIDGINERVIDIVSTPVGILAAWGGRRYLRKLWSTKPSSENILDADLMEIKKPAN